SAEGLTAVEVASHMVLGGSLIANSINTDAEDPVKSLEAEILIKLQSGDCYVSFSGGRDSSTILATGARVAKAHRLRPPVPVTLRFASDPASHESEWQDGLVNSLGLDDWKVIDMEHDLELLGPWAERSIREFGLTFPSNAYLHMPMFEFARGATLMTGLDGDGLFGSWRWRSHSAIRNRQRKPRPREIPGMVHAMMPAGMRAAIGHVNGKMDIHWLKEPFRSRLRKQWVDEVSREPSHWARWVEWFAGRRYLTLATSSLQRLASLSDTRVVHPFLSQRFLSSIAAKAAPGGFGNRTEAMKMLFGGVVPDEILERSSKARFVSSLWGPKTRQFIQDWDGSGIDVAVIDEQALREEWANTEPNFATSLLVQQAWLASIR
ncbi:MAG: hypothetical protein LC723_14205, partial [Actinobacteria bacterium]|nr:hypothetical protein [Actinomycetota bacterium]